MESELSSLRSIVEKTNVLRECAETTYLSFIRAKLGLMLSTLSVGKPYCESK